MNEGERGVTVTGDADRVRIVLRIRGHVQGVGYRVSARREAARLGINAQPENLSDGSVRVEAHGRPGPVADFRRWCEQGPELARVETVEEEVAGMDGR